MFSTVLWDAEMNVPDEAFPSMAINSWMPIGFENIKLFGPLVGLAQCSLCYPDWWLQHFRVSDSNLFQLYMKILSGIQPGTFCMQVYYPWSTVF